MNKKAFLSFVLLAQGIYPQESSTENTSTIFLHGILNNQSQLDHYKAAEAIITPAQAAAFDDSQKPTESGLNTTLYTIGSIFGKRINRAKMFMGQSGDIKIAKDICKNHTQPYILYGFSRGGAVAVSAATINNQNLKTLVIEAAPYDISRIAYVAKCYLGIPFDHKNIFSYVFPSYNPLHNLNAYAIKKIRNKNLPILILHSEPDIAATISEALRYYVHFKHEGFENVYLVRLPEGDHGRVITNPKMGPLYLEVLHSFYKAYNLPYLEKHARLNAQDLKKYFQPNVANIEKEIAAHEAILNSIYRSSKKRNLTIGAAITAISVATIAAIAWATRSKSKESDEKSYITNT